MDNPGLIGRTAELGLLDRFLRQAADGGRAALLTGEAGVGKSALLSAAADRARAAGTRVLSAAGVEFEADVSYAGLNQLLLPIEERIDLIDAGYRDALVVALGLGAGPAPDRLLVANATLALLRGLARTEPVLIVVDDLPWLDRASSMVLGFLARRLGGSAIGLLGAARPGTETFFERTGVDEHTIGPLDDAACAELVAARFPALAGRVRERLLGEAKGNPLALLELPIALSDRQRTAGGELPAVLPLTRRLQEVFARQISGLPVATRRLLLLAALERSGDLRLLQADLAPAEQARLVEVDVNTGQVRFRHPLVRSAVVGLSTHAERQECHRILAGLLVADPELQAWHLAAAATGPDERVALLLERIARRILQRGDAVGAVAALLRAAELSPQASDRGRRLIDAAYIGAEETGELSNASRLLADARAADSRLGSSLPAASATAYLMLNADGDLQTTHRLLVGAIETGDHGYDAGNPALIEAMHNLLLLCWWGGRPEYWEPFYDALGKLTPRPPELLSVLSKTFPDPVRTLPAALPELDALLDGAHAETDPTMVIRLGTASVYADRLSDSIEAHWRVVRQCRAGGPVRRHIGALMHLCMHDFLTGQWTEAYELAAEGLELATEHGYHFFKWYFQFNLANVAAGRGDAGLARELADQITEWALPRGIRSAAIFAEQGRVYAAMAAGDFEAAFAHATAITPAGELASHTPQALWTVLDLVDSAMRTGRQADADAHVTALLEANVAAISSRMALVVAGARAFAGDDLDLFDAALAVPGADQWVYEYARIQLVHGERLRRARSTTAARERLTAAKSAFDRMGAEPWSDWAAGELRATGLNVTRGGLGKPVSLTPQEREIAELAAAGLTNKQIAERLYLSHRTVGSHLYQIFPKLGITSRAALRDALASLDA